MSRIESRRDLFEQIGEVAVNVAAEELVDVETFTIEIRKQRRVFLTRRLQKDADEERTARELLHEQIARGFAGCDMLAPCDVCHQAGGFGGVESFQTQGVEKLKVALRVVGGFENLAT